MQPADPASNTNIDGDHGANPGYALGQLAKAFSTNQTHSDSATRERAGKKVENWLKVLAGMLSGFLRVGSRTPVANTPAWATLAVAQGGFSTGELLAGGPLQPHESELLARHGLEASAPPRAALNTYYLGDAGLADLQRLLSNGHYRVNVPEEGALLAIAWLLAHGHVEQARAVLDHIAPFLGSLRFYPVPAARPLASSSVVYLQTVGQTVQQLQAIRAPSRFLAQREATTVWAPLCDRAVTLFVDTLDGPVPSLLTGPNGKPVRSATGKYQIEGGWPCQRYPDGWAERARALLDDYRRLRAAHRLCGKPERPGQNFTLLREYLEICVTGSRQLTGRDVGMIRLVIASIAGCRGLPGSERSQRLRDHQAQLAARPSRVELARVVLGRLTWLPQDDGAADVEAMLAPVNADEAAAHCLAPGQALADRLDKTVRRCLAAPVETLLQRGIIGSSEALARVIPQLAAQMRGAGLGDEESRRLFAALYQAFRRRRSLLLFHLQSQVKLEELPWVRALDAHRRDGVDVRDQARRLLEQVVRLALTAFPQQIFPNKLLQEVRALADTAGLELPIVDEVAADIFKGRFSAKFLRAAQHAAELLEGTLYARYYRIDYAVVRQIAAEQASLFTALCVERAGAAGGTWSVARNGTIIEQEQILTTHNLAALFGALGLAQSLGAELDALARRCFVWICRELQKKVDSWQARLRLVKNTAYAWRQMVFFLGQLPDAAVTEFLAWANEHLAQKTAVFQERFRPALLGLARAADGTESVEPGDACLFLGWTTQKHWLLA